MGLRTWETQDALYSQGRQSLSVVNNKRVAAGLGAISAAENLHTITRAPAGKSYHNFGCAIDLVEDGDPYKAGIQWSWASTKNYYKIGQEAKKFPEITWGGTFRSIIDLPHIEIHGNVSLASMNLLYKSGGIQKVWDAVDEDLRIQRLL